MVGWEIGGGGTLLKPDGTHIHQWSRTIQAIAWLITLTDRLSVSWTLMNEPQQNCNQNEMIFVTRNGYCHLQNSQPFCSDLLNVFICNWHQLLISFIHIMPKQSVLNTYLSCQDIFSYIYINFFSLSQDSPRADPVSCIFPEGCFIKWISPYCFVNLIYHKILITHNFLSGIILKFWTEHDSITAVLCAKFQMIPQLQGKI